MKKQSRWEWIVSLLLSTLLVVFVRDLVKPGLPMFHDSNPHISRMIAYHTAFNDGQWPPMWAKEVLGDIGSPVLMLNYQLPYWLGELWHRIGLTFVESYKLNLGLSLVASGLLMYWALRKRYGQLSSWVGALLYSLAPYRMVDIYVRGALGESLSFIFPPLILAGFAEHSYVWLTLGWAGLFLTHPVAAALFSAFFLGQALIKKVPWREMVIPYVVALLIAGFNIVPTLIYTRYTYYSPALSDTLTMFPTLGQLVNSPWGYGVSLPGTNDGMSFELGKVQWIVLIVFAVYAVQKRRLEPRYCGVMAAFNLLMILPLTQPLYQLFLGQIIDFPWRLLLTLVFVVSLMGAEIFAQLKGQKLWLIGIAVTICLIGQTVPIAHTHDYWGAEHDEAFFARETGDSYGEYAPRTRETRDSAPFGLRAEFIEGTGMITTLEERSNWQRYKVISDQEGVIRINTAYFPGWQIPSNCFITKRTLKHIDDSGLISCPVARGEQIIEIKYVAPAGQKLGNLLTLAGLGGFVWILFRSYYPRITKPRR